MKKIIPIFIATIACGIYAHSAHATTDDRDGDGFSNDAEIQIYGTDPDNAQSRPGSVMNASVATTAKITGPKRIEVDLSEQRLRYYGGSTLVGEVAISSGLRKTPTPVGTFAIQTKVPVKAYVGPGYYLPNTKWNMRFHAGGYYIHGAYWHNNFGRPMSHGCVNVPYAAMEQLYAFADIGTRVVIRN